MNKAITIDGITYNLTPVEPEPAAKEPPEPEYPDAAKWKRAEWGNDYWTYTSIEPIERLEENDYYDKDHYSCANYFATITDAQEQFDREALARRIQRWRDEHDPIKLDWGNPKQEKWYYQYSYYTNAIIMETSFVVKLPNTTHFSSKQLVIRCIYIFGDEIKRVFYDIVPPYVPILPKVADTLRRVVIPAWTAERDRGPKMNIGIHSDEIEAESLENEQKKKGDN